VSFLLLDRQIVSGRREKKERKKWKEGRKSRMGRDRRGRREGTRIILLKNGWTLQKIHKIVDHFFDQ
jgi:hypothetical protein